MWWDIGGSVPLWAAAVQRRRASESGVALRGRGVVKLNARGGLRAPRWLKGRDATALCRRRLGVTPTGHLLLQLLQLCRSHVRFPRGFDWFGQQARGLLGPWYPPMLLRRRPPCAHTAVLAVENLVQGGIDP